MASVGREPNGACGRGKLADVIRLLTLAPPVAFNAVKYPWADAHRSPCGLNAGWTNYAPV